MTSQRRCSLSSACPTFVQGVVLGLVMMTSLISMADIEADRKLSPRSATEAVVSDKQQMSAETAAAVNFRLTPRARSPEVATPLPVDMATTTERDMTDTDIDWSAATINVSSLSSTMNRYNIQPHIDLAIGVYSRIANQSTGPSIVSLSAKSVNKWQSLQNRTTIASLAATRENARSRPSKISVLDISRKLPKRHNQSMPDILMDAAANPTGNSLTADVPAINRLTTLNGSPPRRPVSSSANVSVTGPAVVAVFPVDFGDADNNNEDDDGWKPVMELLRDVGYQLSGLRSFVRRLRIDNSVLYRDMIRAVLTADRTGVEPSSCADDYDGDGVDDDDDDEVNWDDGSDDGDEGYAKRGQDFTSASTRRKQRIESGSTKSNPVSGDGNQNKAATVRPYDREPSTAIGRVTDAIKRQRCPVGFDRVPGKPSSTCFRFYTDRTTWSIARDRCRALGGRLAALRSAVQQRYLVDTARSRRETVHCDFWIGLTRDQPHHQQRHRPHQRRRHRIESPRRQHRYRRPSGFGRRRGGGTKGRSQPHLPLDDGWSWIDGGRGKQKTISRQTATYTNWNEGEPNDAGGSGQERCVEALWVFGWKWNDARCDGPSTACYVCETDIVE